MYSYVESNTFVSDFNMFLLLSLLLILPILKTSAAHIPTAYGLVAFDSRHILLIHYLGNFSGVE